jgi:Glycoside hydrolase family 44
MLVGTTLRYVALLALFGSFGCASACRRTAPTALDTQPAASKSEAAETDHVVNPGYVAGVDVHLNVRTDVGRHPISPLIYGINYDLDDAPKQRWGLVRSGGNRLTAYNWENNASNAGSDWQYQNDGLVSDSNVPAEPLVKGIDFATSFGAASIITLSNADYVSADKNGGGDVRASGPDYLKTRFKRNYPRKPGPFSEQPDTTDDAVYQDEFVAFLRRLRPEAKILFSMDNEPDLWSHTHAEIFPKPVTYADLWRRNHDFAAAAKDAWPGAEVLGFVSYGYTGYTSLQNAPDGNGRDFIDWYLDQARTAEQREGRRLIDYLDVHWYPEAGAAGQRITTDVLTPAVVEAREQAPRSLWDPNYREESWIADKIGGPIQLIPLLKGKISNHYPGTKLAITEWNFGAGNFISGAIATADVLGIYGRYAVDLASYWPLSGDEHYAFAAVRAYRNYDGKGSAFGDVSVAATSSDVRATTVYASIDSANPARTVIIVINKETRPRVAGIEVAHPRLYTRARTFRLSTEAPVVVEGPVLLVAATNSFRLEMLPQSVNVVVPEE